jgi:hypothetical protein
MPEVVLFHGYAETPDGIWFPYIKEELESRGCRVTYPKLPDPMMPDITAWLNAALPLTVGWDASTIVVGHSLGGLLAMRLLETPPVPAVHALITIGTPFSKLHGYEWMTPFLQRRSPIERLRRQAARFLVVQARDDGIVSPKHARRHVKTLGGELRLVSQGGHFIEIEAPEVLEVINEVLLDLT